MTNTHYKIEVTDERGLTEHWSERGTISGAEEEAERLLRKHKRPVTVFRVETEVVRQYDPPNADYLRAEADEHAQRPRKFSEDTEPEANSGQT